MANLFRGSWDGNVNGGQRGSRQSGRRLSPHSLLGAAGEQPLPPDPATLRLALILRQVEQTLFFAARSGALERALQEALGVTTDGGQGLALLQTWKNREAPRGPWALPSIQLVAADVLPAQRGAYVADLNTILLNRQWLATATNAEVMAVLIEEYGHRLDHLFNPSDTPGDEGARFKDLVLGTPAAPSDYADDQFEVVVGGRTFLAEAAAITASTAGAYTGTPENDTITGSTGNDSLDGGAGLDTLRGGSGNDTLRGGGGNDVIDGGAGFDILDLSDATGNLTVTLSSNSATAATVSDTGAGGIGTDTYTFIEGVVAGRGNDSITGSASGDLLAGGDGNDSLNGAAGNDTLRGGSGDDVIDGGAGIDLLDVSDAKGNLTFTLSNNSTIAASVGDTTAGGIGKDTYVNIEGVIGGAGNDSITGSDLADLLAGGAGADSLLGGAGNDTLRGGSGDDLIDGGSEIDILDLSDATAALNLTLTPGQGSLSLIAHGLGTDRYTNIEGVLGSSFGDILTAGGASSLNGGDGNDTLRGSSGNDTLIGGTGIDLLDLSSQADGLTLTFFQSALPTQTRTISVPGGGTDTYGQMEGLIAGSGADSITGSSLGDLLAGGAGLDTLRGGTGNDTLRGGAANDVIDGGAGDDILDLSDARGNLSVLLSNSSTIAASVSDTTPGGIGTDTYIGIEGVFAGSGNDTLVGSVNANWLRGGNGKDVLRQSPKGQANTSARGDTLEGGLGDDEYQLTSNSSATVINDSGGNDILFYMPVAPGTFVAGRNIQGVDTISLDPYSTVSGSGLTGDALNNLLVGSLGNDVLSGGGGNDTISGSGGSDTINGGSGADTILITQPKPTLLSNAPVAMDMNGDGTITYVGRNLTKARFNFSRDDDENRDKSTEITAWVAKGDGFLAFDKDRNGIINKTSELAFTCYDENAKTDLDALRRYFDRDKHGGKDGFLDEDDIFYSSFGVWVDKNLSGELGDGICQTGEFMSLQDLKITRIKLTADANIKPFTVAEADNDVTVFGRTQFTINGAQRRAEDVQLATNLPNTATTVSTPDFSASEDGILASGFIQKGVAFNTSQVKVYVSPLAGSLVNVPQGGGYNFIYSARDGWLLYFSDTVNYNTASNPSYFCGIIPPSAFNGTGTTPPTLAQIELQLTNAIKANPVNNQILSPQANGALPPANFAPDIRNDTTRGSINFDPSAPVWSNAEVTVSGGTEDSLAASGQFNVVDLNTLDVVRAVVDAVTPVWTQRVGTVAIPTPLSNASLLAMLDIRDIYGNRNPIALTADPFLGSSLNWNFNQNDPGVINPFGTSNRFDWLAAGESVALTYTIKVTDNVATSQPSLSDTQQVRITITGVNDGPITIADVNGSDLVTEAGVKPDNTAFPGDSSATGNLLSNDTDLDLTDTKTVTTTGTFTGIYGSVVIGANGVWTYTLNNADPDTNALAQTSIVTDVFAYTMRDNNGASSSSTLTITINGTNDVPVISGTVNNAADPLKEDTDLSATGTLTSVDTDYGASANWSIQSSATGTYGSLALNGNSGAWTYTLANGTNGVASPVQNLGEGQTVTDIFSVRVTDDFGAYVDQTVTFTITGTNDAAVITGGSTASLTETNAVQSTGGALNATDVDGSSAFVAQTNVAGTGGFGKFSINAAGVWTYTMDSAHDEFLDSTDYTDSLTVATADGTTQLLTVTITGTSDGLPPLFTTEADTVNFNNITLADYDPLSYSDALEGDDVVVLLSRSNAVQIASFSGGAGNDRIVGSDGFYSGNNSYGINNSGLIDGGADNDTITGSGENYLYGINNAIGATITGGTGNDSIAGTAGSGETFDASGGLFNDGLIDGGSGDDTTIGSDGNYGLYNNGTIQGGDGNDATAGSSGAYGGLFNIGLIDGGADSDLISGSGGTYGIYNHGTVLGALTDATINGGDGNDAITGSGGAYGIQNRGEITGGAGIDSITGSGTLDGINNDGLIDGGVGDDSIAGSGGSTGIVNFGLIHGGDGIDIIDGSGGSSEGIFNTGLIDGGAVGDIIVGSGGVTGNGIYNAGTITGGDGDDSIAGSEGTGGYSGILNFGLIDGGGGDAGDDTITGSGSGFGINNQTAGRITGGDGNDSITGSGGSFEGIYNTGLIDGGADDDTITGSGGNGGIFNGGTINGGAGNDSITGTGENDDFGIYNDVTITGGDGNDSIAGSGDVRGIFNFGLIDGGADNDSITALGGIEGMSNEGTIIGGLGNDTVAATGGTTWGIFNSGTITGDAGDDSIAGDGGSDEGITNFGLIDGGSDNDTIKGSSTSSHGIYNGGTITGGAGDDSITGSGGSYDFGIFNDSTLSGGAGNDTIGGSGGLSGIENYGLIDGGADDDSITGSGGIYGIYNGYAATIDGGSGSNVFSGSQQIGEGGEGSGHGIYNDGTISFGDGNDIITGSADIGLAITNNEYINTGGGSDIVDALTGGFGGTGSTYLGAGEDTLKGFGSGYFFGGDFDGEVIVDDELDAIHLNPGYYNITATNSGGYFEITDASDPYSSTTMILNGLERLGTNSETLSDGLWFIDVNGAAFITS